MYDPDEPHVGTPPRIPGYEDGYCGGSETPSDSLDLDPMLYPHRKEPVQVEFNMGETFEQYEARKESAALAQERVDYW